jgi:hypothetical protein
MAGRTVALKQVFQAEEPLALQLKVQQELLEVLTSLAVAGAVGVTLRRLVLAVLVALRLVAGAAVVLVTALPLALAVLAVLALCVFTLGKE